jgi:hypothetical protein
MMITAEQILKLTFAMLASQEGHTEKFMLLLANKADVHATDLVIIII